MKSLQIHPRWIMLLGATLLVTIGVGLLGQDLWLAAKAELAACLLDRSFAAYLADGQPHPPWTWADITPVACLEAPRLHVYRHVLTGASGESMAFGLGHLDGTAQPNTHGNCVLTGHRDSWCAFLAQLERKDLLVLRTRAGARIYQVEDMDVVHHQDLSPLAASDDTLLTMITCYPFQGLRAGEKRYVVRCQLVEAHRQPGPVALRKQVVVAPFRTPGYDQPRWHRPTTIRSSHEQNSTGTDSRRL